MERDLTPQAGAIPYRVTDEGGVDVLLITTSAGRWSIPKGGIDPGHTAEHTAVLEALEEAGVIGVLEKPALGTYERRRVDQDHHVTVFALRVERVLERWQEQDIREREWLPANIAAERAGLEEVGRLILQLARRKRPRTKGRKTG